jgi:type IV pilus assembly protein PilZ
MSSPRFSGGIARQATLSVSIRDKASLYLAYMPFIKNGGLFIPTPRPSSLGEDIGLSIQLMDEPDRIPVACKVVWITPKGAEGGKQMGIGVQFSEQDGGATRARIETYLAGAVESERPTHTM